LDRAEELEVKGLIVDVIGTLIASRELTQTQAAELFGMKQPNVSRHLNHRLSSCSFERLFDFLNLLQEDVEIVVKPHLGPGPAG
jgi:predicted XRE-type DNA-binding protein